MVYAGNLIMNQTDLERLNDADRLIREIAADMGLSCLPQEFDVVPANKMLEIMAYRLPVNFSHWSFGRDYEIERTRFEHGYGAPYEVVFNSDPCRAYLMDTNPLPIQVLVIAHVYGHNDFMKNNLHFERSRRDMITSASEATARLRGYERDYGADAVERLIDAGLTVEWNIDPDEESHRESEEDARERLYGWAKQAPTGGQFDDLLRPKREIDSEQKRELRKKTPPEPTVDLLGYVTEHSPRPLQEWEKDVLNVIRNQSTYFMPYRRTKIMNEGWATYWHQRIMQRLFEEKFLTAEDHGFYNLYNARVKAHNPRSINPYLLGSAIFENIEARWNAGRFGKDFEEVSNAQARAAWDTHAMQGRKKILDVRRTHMDWFFVDEFLSSEVVGSLDLYVHYEKDRGNYYESVVEVVDWQTVKRYLVQSLMNWGVPRVLVVDGNYKGSSQLYLRHVYEGLPLDDEYCRKTLDEIFFLWGRPVYLETSEAYVHQVRPKLYMADEQGVHVHDV
jgi:stage V sporulation protein R